MIECGIVEDINDPNELGRVRVRVFGLHSHNITDIPTEDLPWASVMQPTTSAANSGIGMTPRLLPGSMVIVMFMDEHKQFPMVIGSLPAELSSVFMNVEGTDVQRGNKDYGFQDPTNQYPAQDYIGQNDLPKLSRSVDNEYPRETFEVQNDLFTITEPADLRQNHVYPHNQVRQTSSGHYQEWDDTTGNERINTQHKSGAFEEIRPDGTIVRKIVGDEFHITVKDKNVYVGGSVNVHVENDANINIVKNANVTVGENVVALVKGNVETTVNGSVTASVDGSVDATIGGSLTATVSGSTTVDCSQSTFTGNVSVGGALDVTSTIKAGDNISTTADVKTTSISLNNHKHKGVQAGSSITSTPV